MTNYSMNDNEDLLEALADIAYTAGIERYRVDDSRQIMTNLIEWAKEFDRLHQLTNWEDVDYIETVDKFTYGKLRLANLTK